MTDDERQMHRFTELAEACYAKGRYTFTDFLGLAECDLFLRAARDFSYVPYTLFGGTEGCERVMARFGDEENLGYAPEEFPIVCLRIAPTAPKFAEPLTHRDCLGALMNLGVKRECLGDLARGEECMYLFATKTLAPFLCENLRRVRHTDVRLTETPPPPSVLVAVERERIQVTSPRLDAIVAHAYRLSRSESSTLFAGGRVFCNGRCVTDGTVSPRGGDLLSVRGYGRLRYVEEDGVSRKGKKNLILEKFV